MTAHTPPAHTSRTVRRLAEAFHNGPLSAGDHPFDESSEQGKWCLGVAAFFLAEIQKNAEPQPVVGRADNMPLADMARSEAYRTVSRCLRDPKEIRRMGLGKEPTILDVLSWCDRHIASLS